MKLTWIKAKEEYRSGEDLYINKICVAGYSWNGSMSRDDTPEYKTAHRYSGSIYLPGFLNRTLYGDTPENIKDLIEIRVNNWFREVNRE